MKKVFTKTERNRRYVLHQRIKQEFRYSAKGRTVEIESVGKQPSPKVERALKELQTRFGYNLQTTIPTWNIGDKVRIHPRFEKPTEQGRFYEIVGISGKWATIQRYTGRWRRPFPIQINHIISIR